MKVLFLATLLTAPMLAWGQRPQKAAQQLGPDPVYFIDSVEVAQPALQQYAPESIAALTIYKDAEATRLVRARGKDGVVYVETKSFDTRYYCRYFARVRAISCQGGGRNQHPVRAQWPPADHQL